MAPGRVRTTEEGPMILGGCCWPFFLSIDVLTDGSEYTGDAATLFLSIYKKQSSNRSASDGSLNADDNDQDRLQLDDTSLLVARFAIAGCGGDLLSRAAADQRFKLGPVRAVFCAADTMMELASLPGLLYALQTAGAAELSIVSAADPERTESLVKVMHGNQRYPKVRVCQVPSATEKLGETLTWWQVYADEHMIVHASHVQCAGLEKFVVYLYTLPSLLRTQPNTCVGNSLLILPEILSQDDRRGLIDYFSRNDNNLFPIVSRPGQREAAAARLFAAIVIQAQEDIPPMPSATLPDNWCHVFVRRMKKNQYGDIDPNLLIRAQQQTLAWRKNCRDTELLKYFPYKQKEATLEHGDTMKPTFMNNSEKAKWICTGCSIVLDYDAGNLTAGGSTSIELRFVDRVQHHRQQQNTHGNVNPKTEEVGKNECRSSWPDKLESFLQFSAKSAVEHSSPSCIQDEAEINLDGLDSEAEENDCDPLDACLLCLGTCCASPSPYRGASGYALVLPPSESRNGDVVVVLEVGEGFCAQWNRHAGGRSFSKIQLIWISHAHWDHYGGLVNLLRRIKQDNDHMTGANEQSEGPSIKRARHNSSGPGLASPPYLVAPSKVIGYLKLVLDEPGDCFRGILPDNSLQMEHAFTSLNNNFLCNSQSFVFWENVRVDHSCAHSYGCIFGVRRRGKGPPFIFCFSGDTRPSWMFVRVCREISTRHGCRIDFALHEATFDDAEFEMARRKKHSTVQEALQVGRDIDACRLLLTHFSQRYDSVPAIESESERFEGRMQVGFALDGMCIPLFALF